MTWTILSIAVAVLTLSHHRNDAAENAGQPVRTADAIRVQESKVPEAATTEKVEPPAVYKHYRGRVVRAGKGRLTVQLKWRGRRTFRVADDAKITRNGNPARLRRLRSRDQVRLTSTVDADGERLTVVHAWMPL